MSEDLELNDPRFILFSIYGLFVVILLLCFGYQLMRDRCQSLFGFRRQVANEIEEIESEGVIYELISHARKTEIDSLRASFFVRILGNFSLTLQKEHMLQRGSSADNIQNCDAAQKDIEVGLEIESKANGPRANEKNDELDEETVEKGSTDNENRTKREREIVREYTHIVIPYSGVDIDGKIIDGGDGVKIISDNNKKREVSIFCSICLSEYEMHDEVCWSSNSNCTHVFHSECLVKWLVALGRRKSSMQRFSRTPNKKKLLNYQMECPCCRQEFILASRFKEAV